MPARSNKLGIANEVTVRRALTVAAILIALDEKERVVDELAQRN